MTTEVIFYAQIVSIIAYIGSAFWLYRMLVTAKDASIEVLKERIDLLSSANETLRGQAPDVVSESLDRSNRILREQLTRQTSELRSLESERNLLKLEIEDLGRKMGPENASIVGQLIASSSKLGQLNERTDEVAQTWIDDQDKNIANGAPGSSDAVNSDVPLLNGNLSTSPHMEAASDVAYINEPYRILFDFIEFSTGDYIAKLEDHDLQLEFRRFLEDQNDKFSALASQDINELREVGWYVRGILTKAGIETVRKFSMWLS